MQEIWLVWFCQTKGKENLDGLVLSHKTAGFGWLGFFHTKLKEIWMVWFYHTKRKEIWMVWFFSYKTAGNLDGLVLSHKTAGNMDGLVFFTQNCRKFGWFGLNTQKRKEIWMAWFYQQTKGKKVCNV